MSRPADQFVHLPAGNFSEWLRDTETALRSGQAEANVPCGACTACCRSSMLIHIRPEETNAIARIPRELLSPARGWPKGHLMLGFNDRGHCPMLVDDQCSIYADRPQTCRRYDCRVFAATAIPLTTPPQPEIARRVAQWEFQYESDAGREEHRMVKRAAAFLRQNRDLFPPRFLPKPPAQVAALAIQIHRIFAELSAAEKDPATIAQAIVAACLRVS